MFLQENNDRNEIFLFKLPVVRRLIIARTLYLGDNPKEDHKSLSDITCLLVTLKRRFKVEIFSLFLYIISEITFSRKSTIESLP